MVSSAEKGQIEARKWIFADPMEQPSMIMLGLAKKVGKRKVNHEEQPGLAKRRNMGWFCACACNCEVFWGSGALSAQSLHLQFGAESPLRHCCLFSLHDFALVQSQLSKHFGRSQKAALSRDSCISMKPDWGPMWHPSGLVLLSHSPTSIKCSLAVSVELGGISMSHMIARHTYLLPSRSLQSVLLLGWGCHSWCLNHTHCNAHVQPRCLEK